MPKKIHILFLLTFFAPITQAQNWLQMNVNGDAKCFDVDTVANVLFVAGDMTSLGSKNTANGIGIWDGINWDTLPNKLNIPPWSMCHYKNKLYVTGSFYEQPFNCPSKSLMVWDFTTLKWDTVGIGLWNGGSDGGIAKMERINNELYFFGIFDSVFNCKVNNLAKFDGVNWTAINFPYSSLINDIAMYKGELYAYGQFWNLGGNPNMDCVVKYNGTNWVPAGANFEGAHSIEAMTVYKNELYVAGYFLKADGCPGDNITKYDGTSWQEVNGGFSLYGFADAIPRHMEVYNDILYITGNFDKMGTMPTKSIVTYDGTQFCAVDNSIDQCAGPIAVYKNEIYVGGTWFASGTNYQDTVFFMGRQNKFGVDTCQTFAVGVKENYRAENIKVYPNPTTSILNIIDEQNQFQNATINIANYLGQIVFTSSFTSQIDLQNLSAGMYFLTIENKDSKKTIKIIKE